MDERLSIGFRLLYMHAERLSESATPQVRYEIQLSIPSGEPRLEGERLRMPYVFNLTTTPPLLSVTLRGEVVITGRPERLREVLEESRQKGAPSQILHAATQYAMFEAMLLARELGLPPPIPVPPPKRGEKGPPPATMGPV